MVKVVYPEPKVSAFPPATAPWSRGTRSVGQIVREMAFRPNPDPTYVRLHRLFTCEWCSTPLQDQWQNEHDLKTYDHKLVFSQGGSHDATNLMVSCLLCNNVRGNMSVEAFRPIAREVIRPNRPNLRDIAVALAGRNMVAQARSVLTFAGVPKDEATAIIYEHACGGYDFSTKKMFGRAVSHLAGQIKHHYEEMSTDDLAAIYKNFPVQPFADKSNYETVEFAAVSKVVREILLTRYTSLKALLYVGFKASEE